MWKQIAHHVISFTDSNDDLTLWCSAIDRIAQDVLLATGNEIYFCVGRCMKYSISDQGDWETAGPSWSSGFGGSKRNEIPKLAWSVYVRHIGNCFQITRAPAKASITVNVAIPPDTTLHDTAAVHTMWTPGAPLKRRKKVRQLYGYRKVEDDWRLVALFSEEPIT